MKFNLNHSILKEDYIINFNDGLTRFNTPKLKKLSEEQFVMWRAREMGEFLESHNKMFNKYPICNVCNNLANNPKDLVRYFGVNLHNLCFLKIYNIERSKIDDSERDYFDMVYSSLNKKIFTDQ